MVSEQQKSKALIVGATGLVGGFLIRQLVESPEFESIISLSRKPLDIEAKNLDVLLSDFSDLDTDLNDIKVDHVFCCLGTTIKKAGNRNAFRHVDFDLPIQIAHILKRNGAKHISVISALGADPSSRIFYNQVKGQMEEAIKAANYEYTTIVRPSLLLGDREETRIAETLSIKASSLVSPFMMGPLKSIRPVPAEKVAHMMLLDAIDVIHQQREKGVKIIDSKTIFTNG